MLVQQTQFLRYASILIVFYVAIYCSLSAFGNISNYHANWLMVHQTLSMDTLIHNTQRGWRSVQSHWVQHLVLILIILAESLVAICGWIGAIKLWINRNQTAEIFDQSKSFALLSIFIGISLYFFGFLCVACQWFRAWQATGYNPEPVSFQLTILFCVLFLFVRQTR